VPGIALVWRPSRSRQLAGRGAGALSPAAIGPASVRVVLVALPGHAGSPTAGLASCAYGCVTRSCTGLNTSKGVEHE
jgi:hypothetical protein